MIDVAAIVKEQRSKKLRVAPGRGHVGAGRRSSHITAEMEALHERAHLLNRVGEVTT